MRVFKIYILAILSALSLAVTSCDSNPDSEIFMAFATLQSIGSNTWSFSVQESQDSSPVTMTADIGKYDAQNFKVGGRFVITYATSDNKPYTAGKIELYGIESTWSGTAIDATSEEISEVTEQTVIVDYSKLRGNWLNLRVAAPFSFSPTLVGVYVDDSTLDQSYPDVYLGFVSDNPNSTYYQYIYVSYNVGSIMQSDTADGFTLHYMSNGTMKTVKFDKTK